MSVALSIKKNLTTTNTLLFVNLLLVVCFFCQLQYIDIGHYFNADSLYLPSIYLDLFVEKNGLKGWNFNPAPNFFPDMFFYFILMFLCANNFILAAFLYSFIQYFVFLYILGRLFKAIAPGQSPAFHAVVYLIPTLCLLAVFYLHGIYIFGYLLLSRAYHTGQFLMALVSFLIVLDLFKKRTLYRALLLFVFVFSGVISDKLYITSFVIPVIFAGFFFLRKDWKTVLLVSGVSALATVVSLWVFNAINRSGYIWFAAPNINFGLENSINSFHTFMKMVGEYIEYFGYHTLTIYLFLISIVCLCWLLIRRWRSADVTLKFSLIFIIGQAFLLVWAPVLTGSFTGIDTLRYNIYPLYLGGLNLAIFFALAIPRTQFTKTAFKYAMILITAGIFAGGLFRFEPKGLTAFFNYYPEAARKLDNIAEKEGLLRGVGNYWYARYVTLFSKKGVKVHAVFENVTPYFHISNENWFLNPNNKFNFILLNNFADTSQYRANVKGAKLLYNEENLILVKTDVFQYDPVTLFPKKEN